jgi:septal ring factor EnvC (AmiA/AmiB activator)
MIRAPAFALLCALLGLPAQAADSIAAEAARQAGELQAAIDALEQAQSSRDRVAGLTETIRAYEDGLATLREALRRAHLRETTLTLQFQAKREDISQLLGVLGQLESQPAPLLLLHPSGPLGTVRTGMMLSDVTPALQAEATRLGQELQELRDLRQAQEQAAIILSAGLATVQNARTALSQAISDRTDLPRRLVEDAETLRQLQQGVSTLEAFAAGLALDTGDDRSFEDARGTLPLPALGILLRRPMEADAAGVRRPGVTLATRPRALVTSPWPATIRYLGPLLNYGNVIVLEPGGGYLLVLGGLETLYGEVGEVLAAGAPIGLMGGGEPALAEFFAGTQEGSGVQGTETLYMELRQGTEPVDPTEWFAALRE